MPWDTNGNFTRNHDWVSDASQGIDIEADLMEDDAENLRRGIQDCLHKGGYNRPSANLPMGGLRHLNVANAQARNEYPSVNQVQDNSFNFSTACTSADGLAYAVSVPSAPSTPNDGFSVAFVPATTNTGEVTFAINGGTAYPVISNGSVLAEDDIVAGRVYYAYFYSGSFHIVSGGSGSGAPAPMAFSGAQLSNRYLGQQIPNSTSGTVVSWDVLLMDESPGNSYWDAGNPTYFTAPVQGLYDVRANILLRAHQRDEYVDDELLDEFLNTDTVVTNHILDPSTGPLGTPQPPVRTRMAYMYGETWLEGRNWVGGVPQAWYAIGGTQISNFLVDFPGLNGNILGGGSEILFSLSTQGFVALDAGSNVRCKVLQNSTMVDLLARNLRGYHLLLGNMEVAGNPLWYNSSWFSIEKVRDDIPPLPS